MNEGLKKLSQTNNTLAKLVDGVNLTTEESEDLIYNIFVNDTEGHHFATFVGAIHAKGETADELLGFLNVTKRLAVRFDLNNDKDKTVDLSGTGGGKFKTINVSTAASFVVASLWYTVPKAAYFAVTSVTGSADVFAVHGLNLQDLKKEQIENTLNKVGICPFFIPFISPDMKNRTALSRRFFGERQVRVRSPFHLVSNVYSPVEMSYRIYGCYSEKYLEILANLFNKLGFKRSFVFTSEIGMAEISNVGETILVEQNGSEIKKYTLLPQDFGVKEAKEEDIKSGTKEENIKDFERILRGEETGPKSDLVAINAGAALYVLGDVKDFKEGTEKAKEILKSGKAWQKFNQLIQITKS